MGRSQNLGEGACLHCCSWKSKEPKQLQDVLFHHQENRRASNALLQVYEEVARQLEQHLDRRTRHLLVLTGVPLVFPHVPRSAVQQDVSLK